MFSFFHDDKILFCGLCFHLYGGCGINDSSSSISHERHIPFRGMGDIFVTVLDYYIPLHKNEQ